jgi:hypothetical protein
MKQLIMHQFDEKFPPFCTKSEALLEDFHNVVGFSHRIEMYGRNTMGYEVLALLRAPLCADFVNRSLIVTCLPDFFGKIKGYVDGE